MKIKVIKCPANNAPSVEYIENSLEAMQEVVGGYIETVHCFEDAVCVCNEEGWLLAMPENQSAPESGMRGDVFFCGEDGEEFADIGDKQCQFILRECMKRWLKHVSSH